MILFWLEIVLLTYFIYVALYTVIFAIAGRLYKPPALASTVPKKSKFAVFIPAYKEDGVILQVAEDATHQTYPSDLYDVIVIADSLKSSTKEKLNALPVKVFEVTFEKSTKVKALNKALEHFKGAYDYGVIIDADNLMDKNFIQHLNNLHGQGYQAIQGRRAAKNKESSLALLDGLSEEINNYILGKGSTALGLSSALKGSGMSFNYSLLYEQLKEMNSVGGFDRELELRLVNEGSRVLYASQVIVYDERVESSEVFENQRKRWISSQYYYLKQYFFSGIGAFFIGRMAYFNSTILRNIQLPRLLNLGLLVAFTALSILGSLWLPTLHIIWVTVAILTFLGTLLAIPNEYYGRPLIYAILKLPGIFIKMFLLLFKLRGANKKFIHTPHSSSSNNNSN
ncbi:MAG: glycosyltransferase family 2 protein [Fulvivirga sp.]